MDSNLLCAVAVSVARICNCANARQQLRHILGHKDDQVFVDRFAGLVDFSQLKKLRMAKINQQTKLFESEVLLQR